MKQIAISGQNARSTPFSLPCVFFSIGIENIFEIFYFFFAPSQNATYIDGKENYPNCIFWLKFFVVSVGFVVFTS